MHPKKAGWLLIGISILFAIAMIITPNVIADEGQAQTIIFVLVAMWWIPFAYFIKARKRKP